MEMGSIEENAWCAETEEQEGAGLPTQSGNGSEIVTMGTMYNRSRFTDQYLNSLLNINIIII